MEDAELAERLFATAGRLLDASTISGDARALDCAKTTAKLARMVLARELNETERALAELVLTVEDDANKRADEILRDRTH